MSLIITSKVDPHADKVIEYFHSWGIKFFRLNSENFPINTLLSWSISTLKPEHFLLKTSYGRELQKDQVKSVWYRKPMPLNIDQQITNPQVREFIENEYRAFTSGFYLNLSDAFWLNHPTKNRIASNKLFQLKLAQELGFEIPDTLVTNSPEIAREFYYRHDSNIITKPLDQPYLEADDQYFLIYTHKIEEEDLEKLNLVSNSPTLFQEFIPKKLELRITIVGDKIFTASIDSQASEKTRIDWRNYDFQNVTHASFELPKKVEGLCFQLIKRLGLVFGAIDMILTPDGRYIFLEINPNGQYLWIELLTGLPISEAIARLLTERGNNTIL